jgi:hypothetical protein
MTEDEGNYSGFIGDGIGCGMGRYIALHRRWPDSSINVTCGDSTAETRDDKKRWWIL